MDRKDTGYIISSLHVAHSILRSEIGWESGSTSWIILKTTGICLQTTNIDMQLLLLNRCQIC